MQHKYEKRRNSAVNSKRIGFFCMALVLLAGIGISLFLRDDADQEGQDFDQTTNLYTESLSEKNPEDDATLTTNDLNESLWFETLSEILLSDSYSEMMEISTDYCILKYPAKWSEYVFVNYDDDKNILRFEALMYEKTLELFSVYFDDSGAVMLGTLTLDSGEEIELSADISMDENNDLTELERLAVMAMSEDLNELLLTLNQEYDFSTR